MFLYSKKKKKMFRIKNKRYMCIRFIDVLNDHLNDYL